MMLLLAKSHICCRLTLETIIRAACRARKMAAFDIFNRHLPNVTKAVRHGFSELFDST